MSNLEYAALQPCLQRTVDKVLEHLLVWGASTYLTCHYPSSSNTKVLVQLLPLWVLFGRTTSFATRSVDLFFLGSLYRWGWKNGLFLGRGMAKVPDVAPVYYYSSSGSIASTLVVSMHYGERSLPIWVRLVSLRKSGLNAYSYYSHHLWDGPIGMTHGATMLLWRLEMVRLSCYSYQPATVAEQSHCHVRPSVEGVWSDGCSWNGCIDDLISLHAAFASNRLTTLSSVFAPGLYVAVHGGLGNSHWSIALSLSISSPYLIETGCELLHEIQEKEDISASERSSPVLTKIPPIPH